MKKKFLLRASLWRFYPDWPSTAESIESDPEALRLPAVSEWNL